MGSRSFPWGPTVPSICKGILAILEEMSPSVSHAKLVVSKSDSKRSPMMDSVKDQWAPGGLTRPGPFRVADFSGLITHVELRFHYAVQFGSDNHCLCPTNEFSQEMKCWSERERKLLKGDNLLLNKLWSGKVDGDKNKTGREGSPDRLQRQLFLNNAGLWVGVVTSCCS